MLSERMENLINFQINKELESAYIYMDFANFFSRKGLKGFEKWYRVQAREEIEHAEKFIDYMHDEGSEVRLASIDKPECSCAGIIDVLSQGLQHEIYITNLINDIYDEAVQEHDRRTRNFLEWFIEEQAEEEKNATGLIDTYELFARDCRAGLYQMDQELGKR